MAERGKKNLSNPPRQSNQQYLEEQQFQKANSVFQQHEYVNSVACVILHWLGRDESQYSFDRVEPRIFSGDKPVTPDIIALHHNNKRGIIIEIKSERSGKYLHLEGDDLRRQLEGYINAKRWPSQRSGTYRQLDEVDALFVSHFTNAEAYLGEIGQSSTLRSALKVNLALLAWEIVESRRGNQFRIKFQTGSTQDEEICGAFKRLNGYEVNVQTIAAIQETNSVRLRMREPEPLLVLVAKKALSITDPDVLLPEGLVQSERPAYLEGDRIYFLPQALHHYLNSPDDVDRRKFIDQIDRRTVEEALHRLNELGVINKETKSEYYSITTAKRQKDIAELVLRPYAKYLIEKGGLESEARREGMKQQLLPTK